MNLASLLHKTKDFIYPKYCCTCGREGAFVCPSCAGSIHALPRENINAAGFCVYAAFSYSGAVKNAILAAKYSGIHDACGELGALLYYSFADFDIKDKVIVPLPLHKSKLRERGYNQSELIAKEFCRLSTAHMDSSLLAKTLKTKNQAEAESAEQRRKNIHGAFTASPNAQDKDIIIIDDVSTSGATVNEAAFALKRAGAKNIVALVLCHES